MKPVVVIFTDADADGQDPLCSWTGEGPLPEYTAQVDLVLNDARTSWIVVSHRWQVFQTEARAQAGIGPDVRVIVGLRRLDDVLKVGLSEPLTGAGAAARQLRSGRRP